MAEANEQDNRQDAYKEFAAREPGLAVLTDHALRPDQGYLDNFNLRYRLGPVYDIVRYPETRTPMAIAVYGDWGMGKTTAMKWLQGLIDEWNTSGKAEKKINIRPVWFYPLKYQNRQQVWQDLITEVVDATTPSGYRSRSLPKRFLDVVLDILSTFKIKAKIPGEVGEAELELAPLKRLLTKYRKVPPREARLLNEFQATLHKWIHGTLAPNERLLIFVDSIDRCLPEVALQVLEAMHLYLNIEKLIFVVGADKQLAERLVVEHYKKLGLVTSRENDESDEEKRQRVREEEKAKQYLSKMFQVEVHLEPSEQQISDFLDEQLKAIPNWKEPDLSEDEQELFRGLIFELAERNPREVKRLINSALMTGAGAMMVETTPDSQGQIGFNQGLQLFFVRKILNDRYTMASEVRSRRGITFFGHWSQIVRAGREKDRNFPCRIKVPADFGRGVSERLSEPEIGTDGREGPKRLKELKADLSFAPLEYRPLLENPRFSGLLHLLADEDLGRLMQIPYPAEVAEITAAAAPGKDADIIREAIARELRKKPDELTDEDYRSIKELSLAGTQISDVEPLKGIASLESLDLESTRVSELQPLKRLPNLKSLNLDRTQVSDLEPIKGLASLEKLFLGYTQLSHLELLRGLTSLQELSLTGTQVSNLEPLRELTSLQTLNLTGTPVSDLEPLNRLINLQRLYLRGTRVSDLKPLKALTSLQMLYLIGTPVSDLEPLKGLTSLQVLVLGGTHVGDLEPLSGLTTLQTLSLRGTQVTNLEPIKGLPNLQRLHLTDTQVTDLKPVKGLIRLQELWLSGTQVSDEQVAELQKSLPELKIRAVADE